jgi:hypothetical protein
MMMRLSQFLSDPSTLAQVTANYCATESTPDLAG